jgi:16S rRNA (cytidine1402-2'-O)-methyltransferase
LSGPSVEPSEPAAAVGPGDPASPGRLFVVATPIGNLADVTLRALETLAAVPLVAAEDTRLTRRLFDRHGIRSRLVSYHAQSPPGRMAALLAHLREGRDLALVTDAGTPGISDPGEALVAAWAAEGGQVLPIPGPSAVTAAAAASGIVGPRWVFEGFLPRGGAERRERLARIAADERATILFEAPSRVARTLRDLAATCGSGRPGAVCRELTKLHEQIERDTLGGLAAGMATGRIPARGEFVVVVGLAAAVGPGEAGGVAEDVALGQDVSTEDRILAGRAAVDRLVAAGATRAEAARRVAAETGLPRRRLYGGAGG